MIVIVYSFNNYKEKYLIDFHLDNPMTLESLYLKKDDWYFEFPREELIPLVPPATKRLLDVGCGAGITAGKLKQVYGIEEVTGIEFVPRAAQRAMERIDRVVIADLETIQLDFPEGYFDCILCADVLEHLRQPGDLLMKLRRHLSNGGVLVASIPNIRHIVIVLKIIFDKWEYEPAGILDEGHLRFFTFHTIQKMFQDAGFEIVKVADNRSISWKFKLLNLVSFGLLKPFSIYQYLLVVKKRVERDERP